MAKAKEVEQDRFTQIISELCGNALFEEFIEHLEFHYVYMACHTPGDSHSTAFHEGQRELAALICGINKRVHNKWQTIAKAQAQGANG